MEELDEVGRVVEHLCPQCLSPQSFRHQDPRQQRLEKEQRAQHHSKSEKEKSVQCQWAMPNRIDDKQA
jgi:hypothetical protein